MLSRTATGVPHSGQREPGLTSDSPLGRRWMTTLRKLPTTAPKTAHGGDLERYVDSPTVMARGP